jgi:phosphoglycolate phosphatase-like HAD superfamily hydrolase
VVIELVGPLLDDRGALANTYREVLAAERVVLRPGAIAQVAGAATEWALTTLLEGHGRFELVDRVGELARRVEREWSGMVRSGILRPAPGAFAGWDRIDEGAALLLLFGGTPTLAAELLDGCGFETTLDYAVVGSGRDGLPRPDSIRHWIADHQLDPARVRAAIRSEAAALAATAAGVGVVGRIGSSDQEAGEGVAVDRRAADLDRFLTPT